MGENYPVAVPARGFESRWLNDAAARAEALRESGAKNKEIIDRMLGAF